MLKVWVGNLGKYNEGYLVGDWIDLPVAQTELNDFLRNKVELDLTQEQVEESIRKTGVCYEEYMINDYEKDIPYEFGEYENINTLNMIAMASEKVNDMNALAAAIDYLYIDDRDKLINLMLQADEMPFYYFDDKDSWLSKEAKYGYLKAEFTGLDSVLEQYGISNYFDYESYGRDDADVELYDDGYLDTYLLNEIDLNKYSSDELKEMLQEEINELEEPKKTEKDSLKESQKNEKKKERSLER